MDRFTRNDLRIIANRLERVLSSSRVRIEQFVNDGNEEEQVWSFIRVLPSSESEIMQIVQMARTQGWRMTPSGGGAMGSYGNIPRQRPVIVLDTHNLQNIIHYAPEDMLITVEAGMTLHKLQHILAQEGQMLALDPVCDEETTTIGAIVATAKSGPYRAHYGTLRDMVTGLRVVLGDGTAVKMGSHVVKNVAGYDLSKLFIGSLGTLGIITQCTLKVKPIPRYRELCALPGTLNEIISWQRAIMDSSLIPACFELMGEIPLLPGSTATSSPWTLIIGSDENEASARFQRDTLYQLAGQSLQVIGPLEVDDFWREYRRILGAASIVLRLQTQPAHIASLASNIQHQLKADHDITSHISVTLPEGIGRLFLKTEHVDEAKRALTRLRQWVQSQQGTLVIEKAPLAVRHGIEVFYSPRLQDGALELMQLVKDQYDPQHLFNPGIFVGGI
ncbi:FAD-binding oxidoreductase [Sulfobacillus thermosulfidooxidans]|uniref:FAD-binding oxidoreductase n=1 Tax=Sulfobacillus thermosulfidooxidans TaxID=28034 RepID=UPI0009DEEE3B|nr:FAD-binding oxidoreductase [Sulfobacillus thermosulfidooxidans]